MSDAHAQPVEKVETGELLTEDQLNRQQVICVRCGSKILPPSTGVYVDDVECELVSMRKEDAGLVEKVTQFYKVDDMFQFDNVGFTHTKDNIKYLSCADCDLGPLGYHELSTKISYLALQRIKYSA
uniref:Guanine nucleotide exchange factor mss4 n=1 Tax=Pseudodiaptomus poplesia TaxID=213370 RepID=A0A1S6GLC7_9MAXI|nr:guanine nucleotide exchange factor mss4 [Pseudodiaptomus poplesia]